MGSQKDRNRIGKGWSSFFYPFAVRFLSFCNPIFFLPFLGIQLWREGIFITPKQIKIPPKNGAGPSDWKGLKKSVSIIFSQFTDALWRMKQADRYLSQISCQVRWIHIHIRIHFQNLRDGENCVLWSSLTEYLYNRHLPSLCPFFNPSRIFSGSSHLQHVSHL